jgi:hypothetical protein
VVQVEGLFLVLAIDSTKLSNKVQTLRMQCVRCHQCVSTSTCQHAAVMCSAQQTYVCHALPSAADFFSAAAVAAQVVFEAAAPVGSMPPMGSINTQLFPHLYGHIDAAAVTSELSVDRSDDGTFTAIHF